MNNERDLNRGDGGQPCDNDNGTEATPLQKKQNLN